MKKLIEKLFFLFIISIVLAYLPIVVIGIRYSIPVASSVTFQNIPVSPLCNVIKFIKDMLSVILLVLIIIDIFTKRYSFRIKKLVAVCIFAFVFIFTCGTLSIIFSKMFSLSFVIAGIRIIIFILVPILFSILYLDEIFVMKLYKLLSFLNIVELIICLCQSLILYKTYHNLNIALFRVPGTFAGPGLLAMYSIGYLLLCFLLINLKIEKVNLKIIIEMLMINFIVLLTGTRLIMILSTLVFLVTIIQAKRKLKNRYQLIDAVIIISFLPISYLLLKIAEVIANRGSAVGAQMQGGRINIIINYLNNCSMKELLIGKGIGFGTNTFISMEPELSHKFNSSVMDGTINILITQFGLPITVTIILLYGFFIVELIKKYKENLVFIFTFIFVSLALILVGNVLEQFSIGTILVLMNVLMYNKKNILGECNG